MRFKPAAVALTTLLLSVAGQSFSAQPTAAPNRPPPEWRAPGPQMPPGFGAMIPGADPYHLAMHSRKVQRELGLTADQIHRLIRADREIRSSMRELAFSQDPAVPNKGGGSPTQARAGQIERHMQKTKGVIAKVLTPTQTRRLQEITFQINGPCVILMDAAAARPLRLTWEQDSRVRGLCGQMAGQMRDIPLALNGSDAAGRCVAMKANRQPMQQLRAETNRRIIDLFSSGQKVIYAGLVGEPFQLDPADGPPCPGQGKRLAGPDTKRLGKD